MSVLVGKQAPDFTAKAVKGNELIENFTLSDFKGKYIIVFFYPMDFTFVCPTELHAFNDKLAEFQSRGVELVAVSTDSHHVHSAWLRTPKIEGGIEGINYPLVADVTHSITRDYDCLVEGAGVAYRGLFLIDRDFVVRHQVVNDDALGRSVEETLRVVDALQYTDEHGVVCPVDWHKGDKTMETNRDSLKNYFS